MNLLIIGCGKVGAQLANLMDRQGNDIVILDKNEEAFHNLNEDFSGTTVCGIALDMRVLLSAGVKSCDAAVVVTDDDNLNITVSQLVREYFQMENVLAVISDPAREKVYKQFGLKTVCPTNLAADTIDIALTHPWDDKKVIFDTASVSFRCIEETTRYLGQDLSKVKMEEAYAVFGILRASGSMELLSHAKPCIVQAGDKIIVSHVMD